MFAKNIFLISIAIIGASTTANALWGPDYCKRQCTEVECKHTNRQSLCEKHCQGSPEILNSCKTAIVGTPSQQGKINPASQQQMGIPIRKLPPTPQKASLPAASPAPAVSPRPAAPVRQSMTAPMKVSPKPDIPAQEVSGELNIQVDKANADRPPPPPPAAPLSPETEKFFKQFSADFLSASESLKCLTKSITVDESYFKKSILSKIKGKLTSSNANKLFKPYTDYKDYKADMGQYFESMVSLNIKEAFQQWEKKAMLAQEEFQGLITRGIRFAEGVAKKIPGYTPSDKNAGADMMVPYLNALPDPVLKDLNTCIAKSNENSHNPALKNFYAYFLKKIDIEKGKRQDRITQANIKKSLDKVR